VRIDRTDEAACRSPCDDKHISIPPRRGVIVPLADARQRVRLTVFSASPASMRSTSGFVGNVASDHG
jgi:hypothetical protein